MRGWVQRIAVLAAAVLVVGLWPTAAIAGGGGHGCVDATQGEGDTVAIAQSCFGPSVLHTDPGSEVRFVNKDSYLHNVSAQGWGSSSDLRLGDSFSATFQQEGVYPFACTYHYGMTGAVVVGDGMGAGSGQSITVDPVSSESQYQPPEPVAVEQAGGTVEPSASRLAGWSLAAGLGLILGAGLVLVFRRGPRGSA